MSTKLPAPFAYRDRMFHETKIPRANAAALGDEGQRAYSRATALAEHEISDAMAVGETAIADERTRELAALRDKLPHVAEAQRKAHDALYAAEAEAGAAALAAFLTESASPSVEAFVAEIAPALDRARHIQALVEEFVELCRYAKRTGKPLPSFPTPKGVAGRLLAQMVTLVRENPAGFTD